jgi:hypothetical protein
MGLWEVVVPVVSVVVTGGVAVWSKIIDARTKREDRQHARALDYEGRVWHAKNEALRRLVSACRYVKRKALITKQSGTGEDVRYWRARLIQAVGEFHKDIGDEEGISEITAYAAEPVRDALDEMLDVADDQIQKHRLQLFFWRNAENQLELLRLQEREGDPAEDPTSRKSAHALLTDKISEARKNISASDDINVDAVIKLCDRIIDVARQDIQGRYAQ